MSLWRPKLLALSGEENWIDRGFSERRLPRMQKSDHWDREDAKGWPRMAD
ncbi:hypothetical protein HMPREF0262_00335 [Clostridium sp. ATCC 29733]|nr:hypothetical protein HMPREF0262_00335 [Clostridium sp. ATCC 29733]